ncbi:MAG: rod shape-determining protein MreD [Actinomycetes bacterium]
MNLDYRSLSWRLGLICVVTVVFQIAAVSQVKIFGLNADLVPLVAASVGLILGSLPGAIFGFAIGMLLDLALVETVGVASLILLAIGFAAGRLRELRDPQGAIVPLLVGAAATAAAQAGFLVLTFLLGQPVPFGWALLWDLLGTVAVNAAIAIPVFLVVRRCLIAALPEDPRRRRRRAYTTGGLSPLSRS